MTDLELLRADLVGLLLATLLALSLWLLPGAFFEWLIRRALPQHDWRGFGLVLAFSILFLTDFLLLRIGHGLWPAALLHVMLALLGAVLARECLPRLTRVRVAAVTTWWVLIAALYVDVDWKGQLHQSVLVVDLVKHAVVTRELRDHGLPLQDPYFLREEAAGYYHFFYDGVAVLDVLGGAWVDARMAFVALAFLGALAFASLLQLMLRALGWVTVSADRLDRLTCLMCSIGGLDLLGMGLFHALTGRWEPNGEWWGDEISLVPTSATWVPHHLAGVTTAFFALVVMSRASAEDRPSSRRLLATLAGVSLASTFGLSLWIAIAAVVVISGVLLLPGVRTRAWLRTSAITGATSLLLALPHLLDLWATRSQETFPLALWVKPPWYVDSSGGEWPWILSLALAPAIWLLELGLFALGAWLFLRSKRRGERSLLSDMLVMSCVAGLVLNLFVRSTIINNDFGWRTVWFAAVPMMLWTASVLQRATLPRGVPLAIGVMVALGALATVHNVLMARMIQFPGRDQAWGFVNEHPHVDRGLADAYRWAAREVPRDAVLQHNPVMDPRSFAFGVYGVHRTGVADAEANLFGAQRAVVGERLKRFERVFNGDALPVGLSGWHLVVTVRDPLWKSLPSTACVYRSTTVCVTHDLQ